MGVSVGDEFRVGACSSQNVLSAFLDAFKGSPGENQSQSPRAQNPKWRVVEVSVLWHGAVNRSLL